ncbi:unnamed protein product [Ectocarpus sp. 12 AP-2014]
MGLSIVHILCQFRGWHTATHLKTGTAGVHTQICLRVSLSNTQHATHVGLVGHNGKQAVRPVQGCSHDPQTNYNPEQQGPAHWSSGTMQSSTLLLPAVLCCCL